MSQQNQQMTCAPREDSDQPGHPAQLQKLTRLEILDITNFSHYDIWTVNNNNNDQTVWMRRLISSNA